MELPKIWSEQKCYILSKKYGQAPTFTPDGNDFIVHFGDTIVNRVSNHYAEIEFITLKDGVLELEGFIKLMGCTEYEPLKIHIRVNGNTLPCDKVIGRNLNGYIFGEMITRGETFRARIPIDGAKASYHIELLCEYRGLNILKKSVRFGRYSPIGRELRTAYWCAEGWMLRLKNNRLVLKSTERHDVIWQELSVLCELMAGMRRAKFIAAFNRICYHAIRSVNKNQIWLITDRVSKADDNGEALFRYLKNGSNQGIQVYYSLERSSSDFQQVEEIGPVLPFFSFRHKLVYLLANFNISSHADEGMMNPLGDSFVYYRDLLHRSNFIFLQHGVTKDNLSEWLNKYKKNIRGFVTATIPEYHSILNESYHYSEREVWLTGFARYDRLYHDEKRYITIMPTWRKYLTAMIDKQYGKRDFHSGFFSSSYYQFFKTLLSHERLIAAAKNYGYVIQFMPHPNILPIIDSFEANPDIKLLRGETPYRVVLAESNLLLTDYSSVAFDFAYLRKPIIYTQFDSDNFFSGDHVYTKGYFDYTEDGFGEIEYNAERTVDRIIEYMENDCRLKECYKNRIDGIFAYSDQENCSRIVECIRKSVE